MCFACLKSGVSLYEKVCFACLKSGDSLYSNRVFCMFCRHHHTDPMVLEREDYILEAYHKEIKFVPLRVVERWNFAGPEDILTMLTSVVSKVFQLPGQGAKLGSPQWVEAVFRTDSYTFEDLVHHKKLMNKYLKKFRNVLPANGELVLLPGEQVPDRDYARSRTYTYLDSGQ